MAIIDAESFDHGNTALMPLWYDGLSDSDAVPSTAFDSSGRWTGSSAAYINDSATSRYYVHKTSTGYAEGGVSVGLKSTSSDIASGSHAIALCEGTTVHLTVTRNASGGFDVRRGDGTVLGSVNTAFSMAGTWVHIGLEYKIHDSTGYANLYINGVPTPVVAVSGVDTKNGGSTGAITRIKLMNGTGLQANFHRVDDYLQWDVTGSFVAYPGAAKIHRVLPSAQGSENSWVGSDSNSTNNWDLIDDQSSTDYIGTATSGAKDLSVLQDAIVASGGSVHAVQAVALVGKSDSGAAPADLQALYKSTGGTELAQTLATAAQIGVSYVWFKDAWRYVDPNGDAWTIARLNGMEGGVKLA